MLIAFSVQREGNDGTIDARFGRCPFFALLDEQNSESTWVANPAAGASVGAGTGAAQFLLEQGVDMVVTGQVGPKAMEILVAADIPIFLAPADLPLVEAIHKYQAGQLQQYRIQRF
ncbi:MAG: NifB/NifX family molybdenum-iron cluster-binding protein [Deltaproteobacteria bacterium]|nr:NifB/NifX family molybdenum-iron cluster-binding protein [Candidatus Anaeroferrophillus wilburensis]MBN2889137.1 NifB/NifX family molybdenum-iron cluster-binding protein [Deltaproteobacteria bacterium]